MSVAMMPAAAGRTIRLTALVSEAEAAEIARRAGAEGLSVSAYLRARALGGAGETEEDAALRQVDALIGRMEADIDGAIEVLARTNARLKARSPEAGPPEA
jgi:Mobilization protein NikA